ncbi:hypothetical protein ScalyP_jg9325 [Parmales sp. scaly parma]|nr:hypothetical protein ScalyP_jg9325 [Parmales sp. scaly parma]
MHLFIILLGCVFVVSGLVGAPIKVISDVDDTLKSSGDRKLGEKSLGGVDSQLPRNHIYPGAFSFLRELSPPTFERSSSPTSVAILTARASELKWFLEIKPTSKIAVAAASQQLILGPVLYGSVREWVLDGRKGDRKFDNFERLLSTSNPQTKFVFVGDTGEYDEEVRAGERMIRKFPDKILAIFLHVVCRESEKDRISTLKNCLRFETNPNCYAPRFVSETPIIFFKTYVGAATEACKMHLLSKESLLTVIEDSLADCEELNKRRSAYFDIMFDIAYASITLH